MDIEGAVTRVLATASLDAALAEYVSGLARAGEDEIALVTLIENAPHAVSLDLVDEAETFFRGSGAYVEREALAAIEKYRRLTHA